MYQTKIIILIIAVAVASILACKHDHPPASEELKLAYDIQKEGLAEIKLLESMIADQESESIQDLNSKLSLLKNSMIEIEGMQHDHSQCNGDHSKKRFSIPDDEMIKVQSEWRDSIVSIKQQFEKLSQ